MECNCKSKVNEIGLNFTHFQHCTGVSINSVETKINCEGIMLCRRYILEEICTEGYMLCRRYILEEICTEGYMLCRRYILEEICTEGYCCAGDIFWKRYVLILL